MLEVKYPVEIQDKMLAAFVLEARHADGKPYPGTTLKNIAAALFRVMKQNLDAVNVVSFIEKATREKYFPCYHNALDCMLRAYGKMELYAKSIRENGIGIERKRAQVITQDIEAKLWESGILGLHSPQSLLNAVFFYNGKNLCLRGVSEHARLQFSQFPCS